MKNIKTYPVFSSPLEGYHFEGPISTGQRFCWVQIHATPEAKSPGVLQWIDIPEGGLLEEGLETEVHTLCFDEPVAAVLPTDQEGKVIVAKERSLVLVDLENETVIENWGEVIDERPEVRLNDCRAGFDGQAYLGFMAYDCESPIASWGSYRPNQGFKPMIESIKISNGFDWSEEQQDEQGTFRQLIYVDSKSGKVDTHDDEANGVTESSEVWTFRHDITSGNLGTKEVLTNMTPYVSRQLSGCPVVADGGVMAFDENGKAFFVVAEYNGAAAHVIDCSNGEVVAKISIPALKITSACWVGDQLVFTSTCEGIQDVDPADLSDDGKTKLAGSGNMYWCKPEGLKGRAPFAVQI